jgi:ABC-type molybdenum transport system ATPase subunit/photorepair protein PhrA
LAFRHLFASHKPKKYVAKLGNLTWRRNQFCRGWLITGDTGSGKTSSGINQLAHQVFQNEKIGAGCALMKKAFIGKRFRRWRTITDGRRI